MRNALLPLIPCLLTHYTYSCRKLNPSYIFFFPIPSMQQIHILVITGCLYTVPFEAHCKHCTDIFVWIFIVVFSPWHLCLLLHSFWFVLSSIRVVFHGLLWWLRWLRICLQFRRPRFDPWLEKIPWRREWLPTAMFLPGKSHEQRSLVNYSPWGCKSWTWPRN